MFPYTDEEMEDGLNEDIVIPEDYGINFDRNQLTGVTVEGLEAIKVWAMNALLTPRSRYEIFSEDYGSDLEDLIGHAYTPAYVFCEAKRMVEECLLVHPAITGIADFKAVQTGDVLACEFMLETDFGDTEIELEVG